MAEKPEGDRKFKGVRKLTFRGYQLDELVKMPNEKLVELLRARQRRRFRSGLGHGFTKFI
jgi:hypothetical protein